MTTERLAGIVAATTFSLRPPEGNPAPPLPRIGEVHAIAEELAQLRALLEPLRPLEADATDAPWEALNQTHGRMRVYEVFAGGTSVCHVTCCEDGMDAKDCALIAAARNAIAEMLRVVGS